MTAPTGPPRLTRFQGKSKPQSAGAGWGLSVDINVGAMDPSRSFVAIKQNADA